ncbi:hypothetical protein DVH24_023867 [Malus domestica]|uniref:Uncharacterized protein n=1 Tax=Malus domestica TaxID=3750 RepID=A0A498JK64_MALDO|nr:hypothetical protein DVH24_023867 [Malus domestica]
MENQGSSICFHKFLDLSRAPDPSLRMKTSKSFVHKVVLLKWYSENFVKGQWDKEDCISDWQKYNASHLYNQLKKGARKLYKRLRKKECIKIQLSDPKDLKIEG